MSSALRNVVIAQVFLIAAVAIAAFIWRGQEWAVSALFGGAIVLVNSFLLALRVKRADRLEGGSVALTMYAGAAQRFVVTLVGFGIGMGLLKLAPLPMLIAFAAAQLGYMIAAKRQYP